MSTRIGRLASPRLAAAGLFVTLAIACASGAVAGAPVTDPGASAIDAIVRDVGLAPADVLRRIDALEPILAGAPLVVRDRARLVEIQALLDIGRVGDADKLAQAMLAEPARGGDAFALLRAKLAVLRVRLRQSDIKAATPLAHDILAGRSLFEDDALAPEFFAVTASALSRAGEHEPAARLFIDGIHAAERHDRKDQKAYLLVGLCSLNYDMQNNVRALDYCRQGAQIAEQIGDKMARAAAAINLALVYEANGDGKDQLAELQKSLALAREMGLRRAEGMAQIDLADYALTRNDIKGGLEHCREGLRIGRELGDPTMIAVSLTNLGTATVELGDVPGGVKLYEDGVKAVDDAGEKVYVVQFLGGMADLYEKAGRMADANKALRRRIEEGDKLYEKSQAAALAALQSKFDADNRQRAIRLLTLDNQLKSAEIARRNLQARVYWLVGAVLVLGSLLLVVAYRRLRRANRKLSDENVELEHHSLSDPLTGLLNRRALQAFIEPGQPGRQRRQSLAPMAFVMLDADRFKQVNDTYGHACGDAVLVELANRLRGLVRPEDRLFRLGGEEFLVLLPAIADDDLARLCGRILRAVSHAPVVAEGRLIALSVSLGACRFPLSEAMPFATDWQRHLNLADLALMQSKSSGRNRAHQVLRLADASEATLARIEADFTAAQAAGWIEVAMIAGEGREPREPVARLGAVGA